MVGAGSMSGLHHLSQQANGSKINLLMNQMEPQLIDGLCKLIKEEIAKNAPAPKNAVASTNGKPVAIPKLEANDDPWTRKRKLDQIS